MNKNTHQIICTAHACGKTHDFKLYTESVGSAVADEIKVEGDSGYQGILNLHKNSQTPKKKPRGGRLTPEEKAQNRQLSSERMSVHSLRECALRAAGFFPLRLVENIAAKIKVFKIVANKYRNRRRRFGLRMALICGVINFEGGHWG